MYIDCVHHSTNRNKEFDCFPKPKIPLISDWGIGKEDYFVVKNARFYGDITQPRRTWISENCRSSLAAQHFVSRNYSNGLKY